MDLTVFENSMKKWLLIDTQIRVANQKLREMRNEHVTLTKSVCEYIREHKMENRKIETSDSKIESYEQQSHSSLSYSFLEKYLASKRETKKTWDIKRTFKKGMKRGTAKVRESSGYDSDVE
jgi:hypothetical protein